MRKRNLGLFLLAFFLPISALAQFGKLSGKVIDRESKEPLIGASVVVQGTSFGAATDIEGIFRILNVPAGTYTIQTSYIGYQPVTIRDITVIGGLTREVNFELPSTAIEQQPVVITAERPLIEKSATNATRITSSDEIAKLPVRNINAIAALQPGVVLQNQSVYIRGSRADETGYYIEGAGITNVLGTADGSRGGLRMKTSVGGGLITTIPEALQEVSIQAGGYGAQFGGATGGIVQQTFKTGSSRFGFTLQAETDNFGNYPGKKTLGAYSSGYSDYVMTLSGSLVEGVKFFVAGQNSFVRDRNPVFFTGYNFGYLKDAGEAGGTKGDSALVRWDDANVPGRSNNRYTANGTLLFDLSELQIRLAGAYSRDRQSNNNILRNIFALDRLGKRDASEALLDAKVGYFLSAKTLLEFNVNFLDGRNKTYEPAFGDDLMKYNDSLEIARAYGVNTWQTRTAAPPQYTFNGFRFNRPGTTLSGYGKFRQNFIGGSVNLTSQTSNHELKFGGSYQYWTIRNYNMGTNIFIDFFNSPDSVRNNDYVYRYLGGVQGVNNYGFDRFGKPSDAAEDAPRHPYFAAGYFQDKMEFTDLIVNFGLRLDVMYFDSWKFDDPSAPSVDIFNWLLKGLSKSKTKTYLQPRLGFSFPVTDRTVFHLQYGQFVQPPALTSMYAGSSYYPGSVYLPSIELIPDPQAFDVDPIRTTQYEIGFSQQFTDFAAFDLTGFYKDVKGQLQVTTIPITGGVYAGSKYAVYANGDFENVYGLEMSVRMRRFERIQAQFNYTLQDARGTNSFANGAWAAVGITGTVPTQVMPLTFDQTHRGSVNIDYRFGKDDGGPILEQMGVNLLLTFNSGHPYTLSTGGIAQQGPDDGGILNENDPRNRQPLEPINASTTPWVYSIDFRLDKTISLGPANLNVYCYVQNLLNTKNVTNVYARTGNAYDDGFLTNPDLGAKIANGPNRGQTYLNLYRAMNLEDRQHVWRFNGTQNDLFGTPRQLRVGARVEF